MKYYDRKLDDVDGMFMHHNGNSIYIPSYMFKFNFDILDIDDNIDFLCILKIVEWESDAMRFLTEDDIGNTIDIQSMHAGVHLRASDVGDSFLLECYWSPDNEMIVKSTIYNISDRQLIEYPHWIK